ncbi:competence protein TfoX [Celeribacter baekdonensis]|uniref:Competence protein TfoX n=1 Tax=Celeribacter baekdonensis TaxID=875171 RepID=A0A2R4M853_9RHOB|nr:competence protein TfoX [Celeribacter baekdonensis]
MCQGPSCPLPSPQPATSDASYARAGITSAQALRDIGPDAAYARLLAHGSRPHFIGYYAMVMGLQGRPWNDCKGAEETALRARFDAIVNAALADDSESLRFHRRPST